MDSDDTTEPSIAFMVANARSGHLVTEEVRARAFESLARVVQAHVRARLQRLDLEASHDGLVEEVTQTVLVAVLTGRAATKANTAQGLLAYANLVTENTLRDHMRRSARTLRTVGDEVGTAKSPHPTAEALTSDAPREIRIAAEAPQPRLELLVDAGSAPPREIARLLEAVSSLYRIVGGSGVTFRPVDVRSPEVVQ